MDAHKHKHDDRSKNCKKCRRKRLGLTWTGDPPKCNEHRSREKKSYH